MSREEELEVVSKKLSQINEEKMNQKQALSKHDQLEEEIYEIDVLGRKIFPRLFDSWKKDRDFIRQLDIVHADYEQNRRQIQTDLESDKEILLRKKKEIYNAEDQLNDLKYSLMQGDHIE